MDLERNDTRQFGGASAALNTSWATEMSFDDESLEAQLRENIEALMLVPRRRRDRGGRVWSRLSLFALLPLLLGV